MLMEPTTPTARAPKAADPRTAQVSDPVAQGRSATTPAPAGDVVVWRDELLPGSETFIVNQASALSRWRPRYAGMYPRASGLAPSPSLLLTPPGRLGGVRRRVLRSSRRSRALQDLLGDPAVGLVHAHFGRDGIFVAPSATRAGCPLVVTFHGYDVTRLPDHPRSGQRYRRQLADLFERASALVAASRYVEGRLLGLGAPREKLHQLHIGIPVPTPHTPPGDDQRIFFVGRLVEVKGVEDLLQAVAALPPRHRRTPVTLFGDGPLRADLQARARELGVDADFRGHRPPADLRAAMAGGGLLCGPSRRSPAGDVEGFGMVFLEAAAAGLPAVAYRTGGVPEAVEDGVTGLLAPEGDVPALRDALVALLDDPGRARAMGRAGRARVERDFDVRRQSARLEELYDRVRRP